MLREIEIDGLGTMRHCNDWQVNRIRRMRDRRNGAIAWAAFGLGMTLQQFKKLSPELQRAAQDAYNRLCAPNAIAPKRTPQGSRLPRPGEHVSIEQQIELGKRLMAMKAQLPRGHFIPWIEEKSGISYSQAQRWMKTAKGSPAALSSASLP